MRKCLLLLLSVTLLAANELRPIVKIHRPNPPHMVGDGFRVYNYFPEERVATVEETSPFLLLDYNAPHRFAPLAEGQRGVGAHPHRGFETVTFVYEGAIAHRDSRGNAGMIGPGDVQWMTAASGILHEEFHAPDFAKEGGVLHAVQLWVNLPRKHKMSAPKYQTLRDPEMAHVQTDALGSVLRVIAGEYKKRAGVASTFTPMDIYDIHLQKEGSATLNFDRNHNTMILILNGKVEINGEEASFKDLVRFANMPGDIELKALKDSFVLVLSGKPIRHPVVQSGPFVMNTQEQIDQAYRDFEAGHFGSL